jgi:DNA polymerase-1
MRIFKNKFHTWDYLTFYVTDRAEAKQIVSSLDRSILYGLDIETAKHPDFKEHKQAGLCPRLSTIRLLQIFDGVGRSYVFDVRSIGFDVFIHFLRAGRFVAHNAVFEAQHIRYNGVPDINIGCSMLMSQLVHGAEFSPFEEDPEEEEPDGLSRYTRTGHSLDAVTQRLFKVVVNKQSQLSDWSVEELSTGQITYAGLDAVLTYRCAKELLPKIKEYKLERHYKLLKDSQHVVSEMQLQGLPVDWKYHAKLLKGWIAAKEKAAVECKVFFGDTNLSSSAQMNEWLKTYFKDKPEIIENWPKTKKGSFTFVRTELGKYLQLPEITALLNYKKFSKLVDTYGESLTKKRHPITGNLHPGYTLGMTTTGRLSSRNPNAQNFPSDPEFRNMFKAPEGYELVVSDLAQIELRLQAEFSKDPVMCAVFKNGEDIYKQMASSLFKVPVEQVTKPQRKVGKVVMLALGFGMRSKKLGQYALNSGIHESAAFWEKAYKTYHSTFKVYSTWCDRMRDRATKLGYIETLLGKRRKLTKEQIYTAAPNTVIQGTAAELLLLAMLKCKQTCSDFATIVASVHDEVLLLVKKEDAPQAIECLSAAMCAAMVELFPKAVSHKVADASAAVAWGDAKEEL